MSSREIVLDTETTGLSFMTGDRIIEIAGVELINQEITGNYFHEFVNPEKKISYEAFKIHGISNAFLQDKKKFVDVAQDFLDFLKDSTIVAHNIKFDLGFLNYELDKIKIAKISNKQIDTLELARKKFPGARVNLDSLCTKLRVDNSDRKLHGALKDSMLLAQVYLRLVSSIQGYFDFSDQSKNSFFFKKENEKNNKTCMKRYENDFVVILPSKEELFYNKEFLRSFFNK